MNSPRKENIVFTVDNTAYHVVKVPKSAAENGSGEVYYNIYRKDIIDKSDGKSIAKNLSGAYDTSYDLPRAFMFAPAVLCVALFLVRPIPIILFLGIMLCVGATFITTMPDDENNNSIDKAQHKSLKNQIVKKETPMISAKNTYYGKLDHGADAIVRFYAKNNYEREKFLDVLLIPENQVAFAQIFDQIDRSDITKNDRETLTKAMHNYVDAQRYNVIENKSIYSDDIQNILEDSEHRKQASREIYDSFQQNQLD